MDKNLYAVVEQPFVKATDKTDLDKVRAFLENNGFTNLWNNDYQNDYLGIILEDLRWKCADSKWCSIFHWHCFLHNWIKEIKI